MKLGILPIGHIDSKVTGHLKRSLPTFLPYIECFIIPEPALLLESDFDSKRKQYRANMILAEIRVYANRQREFDAILGIVDADISVPELNFVFGEASFPGKEALISVWRLRPEFYGEVPDETIFLSRVVKEAVHEIGHTIGLQHCPCSSCVMHFSNSIVDTENKQTWFCAKCHLKAASRIQSLKN